MIPKQISKNVSNIVYAPLCKTSRLLTGFASQENTHKEQNGHGQGKKTQETAYRGYEHEYGYPANEIGQGQQHGDSAADQRVFHLRLPSVNERVHIFFSKKARHQKSDAQRNTVKINDQECAFGRDDFINQYNHR